VTCPTVIRVTTKAGPPGIGLPPGATGQNGFTIVKDGDTPYAYRLVPPSEVGLPQALGITASPTFAGITLSSLANAVQGIALISTTGAIQRVSIGSGLAIQGGALVATATGGGSGTVTSVGLSLPTGFSVANSPVATSGTITVDFAAGYSLPTTARQNQWDATTTSLTNLLTSPDPFPVYTTGTEVSEIIDALTHLNVDITGATTQHVRNDSGATMAAGTPYHIVGTVGDTTQVRVIPARADDASTMPASGILLQQLTANGAGADGHGATSGPVSGLNTTGATEGSSIWVGLTGGISATRPATNPQVIGTFGRIHASTGSIVVAPSPVLTSVAFSGSYPDLASRPPEISQANAEGGTATVFSLWSAQRVRQAVAAWWQSASGTAGKLLAAANTAAEARSALELGSAALSSTTDFATPASLSAGLASKADLVGGVVPTSQIPAIAISEYLGAVASQSAMLVLSGQRGDWCIRTDSGSAGAWILAGEPSSTLASWVQIPMPAVPVQSVNGQTGTVILGPGDIGAATAAQGQLATTAIQPGAASEIVTIPYAATINIDFALHAGRILAITLTGNIIFTFSNLSPGREVGIDLTCDSTARTVTFPPDVKFLGASGVPATIQPSKVLAIGLMSFGTAAAQVRAGAAAQL
jgi:hypothetical protein